MKIFGVLISLVGGLIGWAMWFPIRSWAFAQIPDTAQWAGIAKIVIVVFIGWFGGIALPLGLISFGILLLFNN